MNVHTNSAPDRHRTLKVLGISGVQKNALDWASRPPGDFAMNQKPVAVMGATPGFVGTARAQLQLRQTLSYNKGRVLPRREVLVARAHKKFDVDGQLTEAKSHDFIRSLLARLYNWTLFLKGEVGPDEQVLVANES